MRGVKEENEWVWWRVSLEENVVGVVKGEEGEVWKKRKLL